MPGNSIPPSTSPKRESSKQAEESSLDQVKGSGNYAEEATEVELIGYQTALNQMVTKLNTTQAARANANLDAANRII